MCERVVQAGDGIAQVLAKNVNLSADDAKEPTITQRIALIPDGLSSRDTWLKKLRTHKIPCINATFLIDYLTKDQHNRPQMIEYSL